jgi:protein-S-isoprenylcysteine O-methyltransferase Ste14
MNFLRRRPIPLLAFSANSVKVEPKEIMMDRSKDLPGVIACPPLIFVAALGLGLILHRLIPIWLFPLTISRPLGIALCLTGVVVGFWGCATMLRAGTNVRPDRPVTALVTGGPFRFSRNPLYLSLIALYLGITLLLEALWPFMMLVPSLLIVHWRIVLREERFLEARFGDAYRAYKTRVRRWL